MKVNNPAGSTDFAYTFETVSSVEASGKQLGIGSNHILGNDGSVEGLQDQIQVMVPIILGLLLVLVAIAGFAVCIKRSTSEKKISFFNL